jgi:hypothetical protein
MNSHMTHIPTARRPLLSDVSFALLFKDGKVDLGSRPVDFGGTFDAEKNEIQVLRFCKGENPQAKTQITFSVVLHHPDKVISGQYPILLLDQIRTLTQRILDDTESECRRLRIISHA